MEFTVENGIVKVENQEGSYQTVSEGTIVYVGDNIKINLGDETVNYGEETKLTLSELTINGDENIDIKSGNWFTRKLKKMHANRRKYISEKGINAVNDFLNKYKKIDSASRDKNNINGKSYQYKKMQNAIL